MHSLVLFMGRLRFRFLPWPPLTKAILDLRFWILASDLCVPKVQKLYHTKAINQQRFQVPDLHLDPH